MTQKILNGIFVIAFIVLLVHSFGGKGTIAGGAITSQCASGQTCLPSLELTGTIGGVVNALQVDTSNTATSSFAVGCIQTTATSTLTPIRFLYNTQATTSITGVGQGVVVWGYGTCPF